MVKQEGFKLWREDMPLDSSWVQNPDEDIVITDDDIKELKDKVAPTGTADEIKQELIEQRRVAREAADLINLQIESRCAYAYLKSLKELAESKGVTNFYEWAKPVEGEHPPNKAKEVFDRLGWKLKGE
jgi:excinuclease UvrABC helicase subunit UvrB